MPRATSRTTTRPISPTARSTAATATLSAALRPATSSRAGAACSIPGALHLLRSDSPPVDVYPVRTTRGTAPGGERPGVAQPRARLVGDAVLRPAPGLAVPEDDHTRSLVYCVARPQRGGRRAVADHGDPGVFAQPGGGVLGCGRVLEHGAQRGRGLDADAPARSARAPGTACRGRPSAPSCAGRGRTQRTPRRAPGRRRVDAPRRRRRRARPRRGRSLTPRPRRRGVRLRPGDRPPRRRASAASPSAMPRSSARRASRSVVAPASSGAAGPSPARSAARRPAACARRAANMVRGALPGSSRSRAAGAPSGG